MPKCLDCGKEQPVMKSVTTIDPKTGMMSAVLCDTCIDNRKEKGRVNCEPSTS